MNVESSAPQRNVSGRLLPTSVFLACGLLLFESSFFAFTSASKTFQAITFIGAPLLFSIMTALAGRHGRWREYRRAFCSFAIAAFALLLMWLLDDLPRRWLDLNSKAPAGRAVVKITDAVLMLLTVLVAGKLLGIDLDSFYLKKGNRPWLGIGVGLAGFAVMAAFALFEARGMEIPERQMLGWAPWILCFVLANGVFEELLFRGLFLRKFEPLVGAALSNLVTAFVFAVGHAGVTYSADLLAFVAITFVFALLWGYLMQKTGSLWGSALFHAGADTLIMIGVFAGIKT